MSQHTDDIRDDEIRIIGYAPQPVRQTKPEHRSGKGIYIVSAVLIIVLGILTAIFWPKDVEDSDIGVFEKPQPETTIEQPNYPLSRFETNTEESFTEKLDTSVNDIALSLYFPHNAIPELMVGKPDPSDNDIILIAQAADIRGDNFKILGAFILKGELLARGLSKKGYCAIIDGRMSIGSSDTTPLFEEAIDKGGDFFRQFPLVDNGVLIENPIKNKSVRKALCSKAGEFFVAITASPESFHDFSQALVDLGVENAISLVGSSKSFGWYVASDGTQTMFGEDLHLYENENYLLWRRR